MRVRASGKTCFVTAATERFVPGTLVTLASFLKHHPAFDGDLVVVHHALPEAHRRHLAQACPGLRFESVSPALRDRLAALGAARPDFAPRLAQLYSLEAFRLRGYRKVLFYDSDVLFQAPVDDLFDSPAALLCCGDEVFLRGGRRHAATFAPLPPAPPPGAPEPAATKAGTTAPSRSPHDRKTKACIAEAGQSRPKQVQIAPGCGSRATEAPATASAPADAGVLERPFGAGFLLIDAALVEQDCYTDLLALVSPDTWRGTATTHTDQLVLNRHFAGRQTLVGWTYDFVLPMAEAIRAREGVDAASARALHFAGPVKPWMPEAMLRWTHGDPKRKPLDLFRRWYDAYVGYLADAHVRSAGDRRRRSRGDRG